MGFDKPDLAFVVHYQAPGSSIAYYQQVGSGRPGPRRVARRAAAGRRGRRHPGLVHLHGLPPARRDRPGPRLSGRRRPASSAWPTLEKQVNLGRSRLQVLMKVLEVEGAVEATGPEVPPHRRALALRPGPHRRGDRSAPGRAAADARLRRHLGLSHGLPAAAARRPRPPPTAGAATAAAVARWLGCRPPSSTPPAATCVTRRSPSSPASSGLSGSTTRPRSPLDRRVEDGRALCRWGDGGWSDLVRQGQGEGHWDDELLDAAAAFVSAWAPDPGPDLGHLGPVVAPSRPPTPSWPSGWASGSGSPSSTSSPSSGRPSRSARWPTAPSRSTTSAGPSRCPGRLPDGPVLLVDDTVASRWTLTTVGSLLRQAGCPAVHPFVLADTSGS